MGPHANDTDTDTPQTHSHSRRLQTPYQPRIGYPWVSPIIASLLLACIYVEHLPAMIDANSPFINLQWFIPIVPFLGGLVVFVLAYDALRFRRHLYNVQKNIQKIENEALCAWESKRKLQEQSYVYSDQTDKLKRFISDRLLEQIDYDEKLLHFRNIAAEIRHNGVICYDIVRSELENILKQGEDHALLSTQTHLSLSDTHRFSKPGTDISNHSAHQAIQAMKYLWDLLDLATAENITMHIGQHLIDCEEQFFQQSLMAEPKGKNNGNKPLQPLFSPRLAMAKVLSNQLEDNEIERLFSSLNEEASNNTRRPMHLSNQHFAISLSGTEHLLGNENHFILLLENLIKNAQFFSSQIESPQSVDRIHLSLSETEGNILVDLYNRGPHIADDQKKKIFQLGFSTRKQQHHHGKGLGLYFVDQIVKAYHGHIQVHNIVNKKTVYSLRIELEDGRIESRMIESFPEDNHVRLKTLESDIPEPSFEWQSDVNITSIEVASSNKPHSERFDVVDDTTFSKTFYDTLSDFGPAFFIDMGSPQQLRFCCLDRQGVNFHLALPSAESRLE